MCAIPRIKIALYTTCNTEPRVLYDPLPCPGRIRDPDPSTLDVATIIASKSDIIILPTPKLPKTAKMPRSVPWRKCAKCGVGGYGHNEGPWWREGSSKLDFLNPIPNACTTSTSPQRYGSSSSKVLNHKVKRTVKSLQSLQERHASRIPLGYLCAEPLPPLTTRHARGTMQPLAT